MTTAAGSDPGLADLTRKGNRSSRNRTTDYFVKTLRRHYGVPKDVALIAVTMVVNAPIHSMDYLRRHKVDIDRTVEVWSEFIVGGWRALEERYGSGKQDNT